MANPRQKRKLRSSCPTIRQKPKSKRTNKSNPTIARSWNKNLTITQNYRKLGLITKLSSSTGGVEPRLTSISGISSEREGPFDAVGDGASGDKFSIRSSQADNRALGAVKVVRDEEGKIIDVIRETAAQQAKNPLGDMLNDIEDEDEQNVVELEESSRKGKKRPSKMSPRDSEWVERLVKRWNDDYDAMSKDIKGNPMSYSPAELRRRVKLWRESIKEGADAIDVG